MSQHIISNGGRAPKAASSRVVALYEPGTGRIAHVHTVTVFEGARAVSENEAIEEAVARASEAGHQVQNLLTKVSNDPAHGRSPHQIDVQTGQFVPRAAPTRARRK